MGCTITSGIGIVCADLKRVGGIKKNVWAFNMDDLRTPLDVSQTFFTFLPLNTYALLYSFQGTKYAHSAEAKLLRTDSGNVSWEQTITLKVNNTSYQEDQVLENLAVAETGWVVQTNNNDFFIYGAQNGLTCVEQVDPTGVKQGDDEATTVKLMGTEPTFPKRLIVPAGSAGNIVQQTLFYLNAITNVNITV